MSSQPANAVYFTTTRVHLSVTQSKSISILSKPVPENSFPHSPGALSTYVPTIRGTDNSTCQFQTCPVGRYIPRTCSSPHYHTLIFSESMFPSTSQRPLSGETVTKHMEASSHSFFGFNIQAHLERPRKKRMAFEILEKKDKKEGPFSKHM